MADKRMISGSIIDSDIFLDMPPSTQNLYFHLNLRADDEGFIDSPKKVMRIINANQNDLDILLAKKYLLKFNSGVIVIKHWKLHNTIRKDRMKPTMYIEEKSQLLEKDNGAYTFNQYSLSLKEVSNSNTIGLEHHDNRMTTNCGQYPAKCLLSIDKIRLDKTSIDYKEKNTKKEVRHKYGEYKNVLLSEKEYNSLVELWDIEKVSKIIEELSLYIDSKGAKYKNFKSTIIGWEKRSNNFNGFVPKNKVDKFKGDQNFDF